MKIPGGAAAAETDFENRGDVMGIGEAGGHEPGVGRWKLEFVGGIVGAFVVKRLVETEGQQQQVFLFVDVDLIVEGLFRIDKRPVLVRCAGARQQASESGGGDKEAEAF